VVGIKIEVVVWGASIFHLVPIFLIEKRAENFQFLNFLIFFKKVFLFICFKKKYFKPLKNKFTTP
jgi:hypothetical protein